MRNSIDWSRSSAILPQLLTELSKRNPDDPLHFAQGYRRIKGAPMRIPAALHEVYRDPHPLVVVQKPSQVGGTEFLLNQALWCAATGQGGRGNVLYLMPTQENADRLSQDRVARAIGTSPGLEPLARRFRGDLRAPQRMKMRTLGEGVIYFAGSDSVAQYMGVDADLVVLDEYDQMKDEVFSNATGRLRSSELDWMRIASTPTIPEFGVNALLMQSDERHRELRCFSCDSWVEPQFPESVDLGRGLVICHCGEPLDPTQVGRWVPQRPQATDIRGYLLNRLTLPNPPLAKMRLAAGGTIGIRQEEFWRTDLGIPFVASDARLSATDLDNCRSDTLPPLAQQKPDAVLMGVDVGVEVFWVVVRVFYEKRSYLVFAARLVGDWELLDEVIERYRPSFCVVDALPDTRGAKRLRDRFRQRSPYTEVVLAYYRPTGTKHEWSWGSEARVSAVRTLALDEMFDSVRRGQARLPANARELVGGAYYEHLQALVRTTELDDFGQPLPSYRHSRPDDLAHAENYLALIANHSGRWQGWWE